MTTNNNPKIRVVAGIIWNEQQDKILLSKRKSNQDFSGLWEFPGGKVEENEADDLALIRELQEELGITATDLDIALSFEYQYPTKTIDFVIYNVFQFTGTPKGEEFQVVSWVHKDELQNLQFPEANSKLLKYIESTTR